jgi:Acetyltransferase (GNAT) domain
MFVGWLNRSEIDDNAWNGFIGHSPQQIIYAYSWYLDVVAPRWGALVVKDAGGHWLGVLPVPLRQKFGVWIVHQPLFCQLLGVFVAPSVMLEPVATMLLAALPQFFRYNAVYTGLFEGIVQWPSLFKVQFCANYVLPLNEPYEVITKGYTLDRLNNLKRALQWQWQLAESNDIAPLLDLFRQNHASKIGVSTKSYELLSRLFEVLQQQKAVKLLYVLKDGKIEAGAMLALDKRRIIYLFNAASAMGRRGNARTFLIDSILRQYSNQNLQFDFESPEIPSIAAFYRSFGSLSEPYVRFKYNRLPYLLRYLQEWRLSLLPSTNPA